MKIWLFYFINTGIVPTDQPDHHCKFYEKCQSQKEITIDLHSRYQTQKHKK